jgi:HlyD family secretion protein
MNKPDRPEIFNRAEGLLKRAADAGGKALQTAKGAGENAWRQATGDPDDPNHRRRVLIMLGGGILAVILVMAVLSRLGGEGGAAVERVSSAQAVSVITTQTRAIQPVVSLNGEARPVRDLQVMAPATGVRILQLLVDEGDTVRQGQAMARLDTNLATAQTRAAQASVAEAESNSVRARGEYERAESIRDSGALSTEAIEQRRAAAIAADARLAAARAQLAEVNARLGGGYVRAPASGLVIDRTAEVGRSVDGQVLFRIAAGNDLEVAAQVAESDALALEVGQTATFTLVDGSTIEARLRRGPASIDSRTRTGEALFQLPQGSRVRAGMYLRGEAHLAPRNVIAVPQSSVLYDQGQAFVYVLGPTGENGESEVTRANILVGARDGDWVEVVTGLDLNQRVVGSGAAFLQSGDNVRPLAEEAEPPPASEQAPEANAADPALRGRE